MPAGTPLSMILDAIETIAPKRFALGFDKVGLQVGNPQAQVQRAVVSLDRSHAAIKYAAEVEAQLLVSHHPVIWDALHTVVVGKYGEESVRLLIQNDMNFVAVHTNWDAAKGGINDTLADLLGLKTMAAFGEAAPVARFKAVVFAPACEAEKIIDAASGVGAGLIGLYERCAFTSPGKGTFRGKRGSAPRIGAPERIEEVDEVRIEMVLDEAIRSAVERAVCQTHSYEAPALDFFKLAEIDEQPISRIGELARPVTLLSFVAGIDERLMTRCWTWGDPDRKIQRVAVCGGAAEDEWRAAKEVGADVLVTGEVSQHVGLEVSESDFAIVAAGHFATEQPGCDALCLRLREKAPMVEWRVFSPGPGFAGRPF